ncbi:MAG: hypothetical protein JSW11_20935 [Candidatus Heimdallarchaeota archaeon]|nr:MAG: hypothetical protein JSW11_20935 [Candidatus Heimdallarchaeota archaeon]
MNYIRRTLSLSIILLLFMNIVAIFSIADNSAFSGFLDQSVQKEVGQETTVSNHDPQAKIGNVITSGKTTLKTDKDTYAPGEWLEITAESTTEEMNGSLEWSLESPISEVSFDFESEIQDIFEDSAFDSPSLPDWTNDNFYSIEATSGYLNLTEIADVDTEDAEIFFNTSELMPDRYEISFDYFSQGQNLLMNPGFEGGNTNGWDFNSSYVKVVEDPINASDGSYYLEINGTEGYLLNQSVNLVGEDRLIVFVVKATGVGSDNFWDLRLEAYNSSGNRIGYKISSDDSRDYTPDDKGYVTQVLSWKTPENTTQIRAIFYGRDAAVDDYYTGRLDECYFYEVPPDLTFSYWHEEGENSQWENRTIASVAIHEWVNESFKIDMARNDFKTFRFILSDDNTFANNQTSYWLIDNTRVDRVTVPADEMGPIIKSAYRETFQGQISSTWIHHGLSEELVSTYDIEVEPFENETTPSDCLATIQLQLPTHQIYFGSWIFVYQIHRIDNDNEYIDTKSINISLTIEDSMNYVVQDIYMHRGFTNETHGTGNDTQSIFTEYFEKESDIEALSPGDNVTILGFLEANSTIGEYYSLDYLNLWSVWVNYRWDSNWYSRENITWRETEYIQYNKEGETILDGNFTTPLNNARTMGLNFKIPNRGIYGKFSANLTISIIGSNTKPGGVGGDPIGLTIPLDLPPIKYKINIVQEHLPATNYYITDYLGGNVTLEFLNYNETLELDYPNRNISINLPIPMKDLELTIFLDNLDQSPSEIDISQQLHYHYIGRTVLWFDPIDPSLEAGTYAFRIRWNTPYKLGVHDQEELDITHSIQVKGAPFVVPAEGMFNLKQGDQKTINFTVHIDNSTGRIIGGLDLIGFLDGNQSKGNLVIYEEAGVYNIDLDIERDAKGKVYTIDIFIVGHSEAIGTISYTVIEVPSETEEQESPFDFAIGIGGFLFFVLVCIGVIGALLWANKSLK